MPASTETTRPTIAGSPNRRRTSAAERCLSLSDNSCLSHNPRLFSFAALSGRVEAGKTSLVGDGSSAETRGDVFVSESPSKRNGPIKSAIIPTKRASMRSKTHTSIRRRGIPRGLRSGMSDFLGRDFSVFPSATSTVNTAGIRKGLRQCGQRITLPAWYGRAAKIIRQWRQEKSIRISPFVFAPLVPWERPFRPPGGLWHSLAFTHSGRPFSLHLRISRLAEEIIVVVSWNGCREPDPVFRLR